MSFDKRKFQREWKAKIRAAYFQDKSCARCGSSEELELDHINAKEKTGKQDHGIWGWSEDQKAKELLKCQVLCHSCHKDKTLFEDTKIVKLSREKHYELQRRLFSGESITVSLRKEYGLCYKAIQNRKKYLLKCKNPRLWP